MRLFLFVLAFMSFILTGAQQLLGTIQGQITDSITDNPIVNAQLIIYHSGSSSMVFSDHEGRYTIENLPFGRHELFVSHEAYNLKTIISEELSLKNILIHQNIQMIEGHLIEPFELVHEVSYINPCKCTIIYPEIIPISRVPVARRNINLLVAAVLSSVKVSAYGKQIHLRGGKANDVLYNVDGVKSLNMPEVPFGGLSSLNVYNGGIPARFGDTTGGVIEVETKSYFDLYHERNKSVRVNK